MAKAWLALYCQLLFLSVTAQEETNTLDTATLRLVHIYGYAAMDERTMPDLFGPNKPARYVFNRRDTITLQPEWIVTFTREVTSIEVFDIKFNRTDTLIIEYLLTDWKKDFHITFRVLPNDTLPEFVSLAVERLRWLFFKKTEYFEYTFLAPNIKRELLLGIRERMRKAKINIIDLRTRKE